MDPFAWLTDFIDNPSREGLTEARRMGIWLTGRLPDLRLAADCQERLYAALEALLAALGGSIHDIFDRQQAARVILLECKGRVLH